MHTCRSGARAPRRDVDRGVLGSVPLTCRSLSRGNVGTPAEPGRPPDGGPPGCPGVPRRGSRSDDSPPRRGPGDLRRDHRRPAALRARPRRRRRRRRGRPPGRRARRAVGARRPVPLVELRRPASGCSPRPPRSSATPTRCSRSVRPPCTRVSRTRLVILLRAMGSPRQVIRKLPRAVAKFSTTSTMEVVESGATSATIRFRLHEGYEHSRLDCRYAQGLLTHRAHGLRPAARADRARRVRVRRPPRLHLPPDLGPSVAGSRAGTGDARAAEAELNALRGQLRILQSAAYRPRRQRRRRHGAAPHRRPRRRGGPRPRLPARRRRPGRRRPAGAQRRRARRRRSPTWPRPSSPGRTSARAPSSSMSPPPGATTAGWPRCTATAPASMGDETLDARRLRRPRRRRTRPDHRAGGRAPGGRTGHRAARARPRARRPRPTPPRSPTSSARRCPRIVGCTSAGILLWDPATGSLQSQSSVGLDRRRPLAARRRPGSAPRTSPSSSGMLTDREPVILSSATSSPVLRRLLRGRRHRPTSSPSPCSPTATFLGVATAGWRRR